MLNSSATTRAPKGKTGKYLVAGKTLEELSALRELIAKEEAMIRREEQASALAESAAKKTGIEIVFSKAAGNGTYQWEATVCGSTGCHCESGEPGTKHGPYLYLRGVKNDPVPGRNRKSIYIPLRDVEKHPDAPPRPSPEEM